MHSVYLFTCTTTDKSKLDCWETSISFLFLNCKIIRPYRFVRLRKTTRLKHQLHFLNRLLRSPLKMVGLVPLFHLLPPSGCCNVPCTLWVPVLSTASLYWGTQLLWTSAEKKGHSCFTCLNMKNEPMQIQCLQVYINVI